MYPKGISGPGMYGAYIPSRDTGLGAIFASDTPQQKLDKAWQAVEDITWIWSNGVVIDWWPDEKSVAYNIGRMQDTNPAAYTDLKPLYDDTMKAIQDIRGLYLDMKKRGPFSDADAVKMSGILTALEVQMQGVRKAASAANITELSMFLRGSLGIAMEGLSVLGEMFRRLWGGIKSTFEFATGNLTALLIGGLVLYFVLPKVAMGFAQGRASKSTP